MLNTHCSQHGKQPVLSNDVNLEEIAALTDSFTGADLAGLVRQASLQALRDSLQFEFVADTEIDLSVHKRHFMVALKQLRPSVTSEVKITIHYLYFNSHTFSQYSVLFFSLQDKVQYEKLRLKYSSAADK